MTQMGRDMKFGLYSCMYSECNSLRNERKSSIDLLNKLKMRITTMARQPVLGLVAVIIPPATILRHYYFSIEYELCRFPGDGILTSQTPYF